MLPTCAGLQAATSMLPTPSRLLLRGRFNALATTSTSLAPNLVENSCQAGCIGSRRSAKDSLERLS